jgi:ectoine hydroxylase-related dioxygenase (phytanoyl-CoA dioxygenase family)
MKAGEGVTHSNIAQLSRENAPERVTGLFLPSDQTDDAAGRVIAEIVELGLERNAWELDAIGYTVVTPEQVAAGDLTARLREKLLDMTEAEVGFRPDLDAGERLAADVTAIGRGHFLPSVLLRDPIFEEALMTRSLLALMTYLLGENCILSSTSAMLKVRAAESLELHSDQVGQPSPLPAYAQVANVHWVLTDYSAEHGATRFVPGSHKLCRHPTTAEALDPTLGIPVSAPAGSMIIWHGNTWHGAAPRTTPGVRMSLIMLFCRWYLTPQIPHRQLARPEMLARNPSRFTTLMGKRIRIPGWTPTARQSTSRSARQASSHERQMRRWALNRAAPAASATWSLTSAGRP